MKEQIENAINWVKDQSNKKVNFVNQKIKGCVTGSCLLNYFEGQDVDVFVYDKDSMRALLYAMIHNSMFTILDEAEQWKVDNFLLNSEKDYYKGIITIKVLYNTCVSVNVTFKHDSTDIYSVISTFDMDIICKGYDLQTGIILDLTNNSTLNKVADWNRHNTSYFSDNVWEMSRVLRQLERVIKYHNRGYNTDKLCYKYLEMTDKLINQENIFKSSKFDESLGLMTDNAVKIKMILELWLKTHTLSKEGIEKLKETYKTI